MESIYFTLQEFMTHTEGVIYLLTGGGLVVLVFFWRFLNRRDEKNRMF